MVDEERVPFLEYLDAKYELDDRSLHQPSRELFVGLLSETKEAAVVDIGTGSGAMVRRVAARLTAGDFRFAGVDLDRSLLDAARDRTRSDLEHEGFRIGAADKELEADRASDSGRCSVRARFLHGDILAPDVQRQLGELGPTAITAHAFIDTVPLAAVTTMVSHLLPGGGLFYATLNYDGRTDLLPRYGDQDLEASIIAAYNRSMDDRAIGGVPIAGSRAGTKLVDRLADSGFTILCCGASDWSLSAVNGAYPPHLRTVLKALIGMIYNEMVVQHAKGGLGIDPDALDAWFRDRLDLIAAGRLTAIVHHIDVLARRGR
jgi:SAM-dependent methyltransferase